VTDEVEVSQSFKEKYAIFTFLDLLLGSGFQIFLQKHPE